MPHSPDHHPCAGKIVKAYPMNLDEGLAAFDELRQLAALWNFDLSRAFRELQDLGLSFLTPQVDRALAVRADRRVVHYQLCDRLMADLVTLRAKQVERNKVEGGAGFGRAPSDERVVDHVEEPAE